MTGEEGKKDTSILLQSAYAALQETHPVLCRTLWWSTNAAFVLAMVGVGHRLDESQQGIAALYFLLSVVPLILLCIMVCSIGKKEMIKQTVSVAEAEIG